jgi:hypothetical protein
MSAEADALRLKIIAFLSQNPHLSKLEFTFRSYRVTPAAYKRDVCNAIKNNDIEVEIHADAPEVVAARYQSRWLIFSDDRLKFNPGFSIAAVRDQATLVHECTHAYFDFLNLGTQPLHPQEGAAYVAAFLFLHAAGGQPPEQRQRLRGIHLAASQIAEGILAGSKMVPEKAADDLIGLIARHPEYQRTQTVRSDGV